MSDTQTTTQDNLLDSLLGDFLDESDQLLTQLNDNLLQLDEWVQSAGDDGGQTCDAELLNEMFRAAHSLKGLSAMLGLGEINTLTHKIENVFDAARSDQLSINGDVVDLVFLGIDQLTALVELLKDPAGEPVDCDAVLEGIRELLRSAGAERKQSSQADADKMLSDSPKEAELEIPDPFEGISDEEDVSEKYLSIFIDEAESALDELSETLLAMEGGLDARDLSRPLVISHKIKGSAASIGLNRVAKLAHLMEDLLQNLVETDGVLSGEATDALLACTDALRQFLAQSKAGTATPDHFSEAARKLLASRLPAPQATGLGARLEGVVAEIRERVQAADAESLSSLTGVAGDTIEKIRAGKSVELAVLKLLTAHFDVADKQPEKQAEAEPQAPPESGPIADGTTFVGEVRFDPDLAMAGLKAALIHEKLAKLGHVSHCDPSADKLDDLERLDIFRFHVVTGETVETIVQQVHVSGVREVQLEPLAAEMPALPPGDGGTTLANQGPATERAADASPATADALPESSVTIEAPGNEAPAPTQAEPVPPARKSPAEASSRNAKPPAAENVSRPTETVRVDIERLDELMNLAGQLVINKAQFSRIGEKLKTALSGKQLAHSLGRAFWELEKMSGAAELRIDERHLETHVQHFHAQACRIQSELEAVRSEVQAVGQARNSVKDLLETIHQFDRVSNAIQQVVMDTRMVPIGPLFTRFNRVVRDIARDSGKEIRLTIQGEKTELDKRMIDELSDPLIHMVRNAADHGIEPPDVRESSGKPCQGTVALDACHRGNSIVIQVSDDGKGLDADRILRKCLEKGILTEADAEKMTPRQLYQMIWVPGMSTAEKVTGVSGRGMGMDIVKSKIEGLNGVVDIDSAPGRGTTMTIKLPVTLAILPSLMVDIAGDVFAMPMEAVTEIVSVGHDRLNTVHGQQMAMVRGRVVSLVRLDEMLAFHRLGRSVENGRSREITLVIVGEPGQEVGLAVDRVIGEEDIVIKSIAENYKNVPGIAGASILGDGRVSLILDIQALIEMVGRKAALASC